jgi:hypothetical protein
MSTEAHKPCPDCGKPMIEAQSWPGLWLCSDSQEPINDSPPYRYACPGMEITKAGMELFRAEFRRVIEGN